MDTDKKLKDCKGKWERDRRKRLNEAFDRLNKVLPSFDPSINLAKIDIIEQATLAIEDFSDKLKKALSVEGKENTKDEVLAKIESRLKKLLLRNELLSNLLKDAGIKVPNGYGTVKKKLPKWSHRVKSDQAKALQKKALEKEIDITKQPKSPTRKKNISKAKPKNVQFRPAFEKKRQRKNPNPKCLIIFSQAAPVNNPFYVVTKNAKNKADTASIQSSVLRAPLVSANARPSLFPGNSSLSTLGPGTLIFPNGSVVPINQTQIPQPTLVANPIQNNCNSTIIIVSKSNSTNKIFQPLISLNTNTSIVSIVTMPQIFTNLNSGVLKSSFNVVQNQWPRIRPRWCSTNTTQVNKVPIPALTSKYNNYVYINNSKLPPAPSKEIKTKDSGKSSNQNKRKVDEKAIEKVKKSKTDCAIEKSTKENEKIKNLNRMPNTINEHIVTEAELDNVTKSAHENDKVDQNVPSKTKHEMIDPQQSQGKDNEKFDQIMTSSGSDKNTFKQQQSTNKVVFNTDDRKIDIKNTEKSNLTKTTPEIPFPPKNSKDDSSIAKQNQIDLNLTHSDLSNDIFASLHVPPGCQNPDSTSPTAAFLMAFPLVSSGIKVTEVIEGDNNDNNSQRETPTLLQIGTIEETKPSQSQTECHSESLTPSLLNLENFSFFSHKDCYNQFGLTTSTPVFSSSMTSNIFSNVTTASYASKKGVFDDLFYTQALSSLISYAPTIKSMPNQPSQSSAISSSKNLTEIDQNFHSQATTNTLINSSSIFTISQSVPSTTKSISGYSSLCSSQLDPVSSNKDIRQNVTGQSTSFIASQSLPTTTKPTSIHSTSEACHSNSNYLNKDKITESHVLSFSGSSSAVATRTKSSIETFFPVSEGSFIYPNKVCTTSNFLNPNLKKHIVSDTSSFITSTFSTDVSSSYSFGIAPAKDLLHSSTNKSLHFTSEGISFPISIYGNTVFNTTDGKKREKENNFQYIMTKNKADVPNNLNSASNVELKNSMATSKANFRNYISHDTTTSNKETSSDNLAKDVNQDHNEHQKVKSAVDQKNSSIQHITSQTNSSLQHNPYDSTLLDNNRYLENTNSVQKEAPQKTEMDANPIVSKTQEVLDKKVMPNLNVQTSLPAQPTNYVHNVFEQHRYTQNHTKQDFPFNPNVPQAKPLDQNSENKKVNLHHTDHRALYNESCKNIFDFKPMNIQAPTTISNETSKLPMEQNVYNQNFFENNANRDLYPISTTKTNSKNVPHLETNSNFHYYPLQLPPSTASSTKVLQDSLINTNPKSVLMNSYQVNQLPQTAKTDSFIQSNQTLFNFNLYSSDAKKTNEINFYLNPVSNNPKYKTASTINQAQLHNNTFTQNFNPYSDDKKSKNESNSNFQCGPNNPKAKNHHVETQNFNFDSYSLDTKNKNEANIYSQTASSNNLKSINDVNPNKNLTSENCGYNPYSLDVKKKNIPNLNLQSESSNNLKVKNESTVNQNQNLDRENFNLNSYNTITKKKHVVPNYSQNGSSSNFKPKTDSTVDTSQNIGAQIYHFDPFSTDSKKSSPSLPNFYSQTESSNNLKAKNESVVNNSQNFHFPPYSMDTKKKNEPTLGIHQKQVYSSKSYEYSNYTNKKVSCTYAPPVSNSNLCYTNAGTCYYDYNAENNYGNSYLKNTSNSGNNSYYFNYNACSENRANDALTSNNYCPSLDPYNRDKFASIITTKSKSSTQQSKPVNWMTNPSNSVSSKDYLLPPFKDNNAFPSSVVSSGYFNTVLTYNPGEASAAGNNKKNLDLSLPNYNTSFQKGQTEENQFSWSPSKVPPFIDSAHSFVSATLPTLIGDLALNIQPHAESKANKEKPNKDSVRKVGVNYNNQNNQPNFLSVSQLVENKEATPAKVTSRRNSGSRTKNTSPQKPKRTVKSDQNNVDQNTPGKATHSQIAETYNDPKQVMKNFNKNVASNYSAEALIQVEPKRNKVAVPNILSDNMVSYFPHVDTQMPADGNSYIQQQQTYPNTSFPYSLSNSFQNNSLSNAPTSYLPSSTFPNDQEFYPEIYNPSLNKEKACHKDGSKASLKPDKTSKKGKKRSANDAVLPSFDIPFLSIPGAINSPILPDDFHHTFLPPTTPYKNPLYPKQSTDIGALLPPLPLVPGSKAGTVQHPDVSPSINTAAGTSLTNFNLSTIFPEINKGPRSSQAYPEKFKSQSEPQSYPISSSGNFGKPTFTFSSYNT